MPQYAENNDFDYSYVSATARVALYDDMKSAPRITKINPAATNDFIEALTTTVYEQAKLAGGGIPYTLIREVSENFIHARFCEIVVSILDGGNTIRFADQGPGIQEKEKAQQPGFSSAIEPMKDYIRGVGSGFPIVKDYLDDREGSIIIEDNLVSGAVVTISLDKRRKASEAARPSLTAFTLPNMHLSEREKTFVQLLQREGELGVTEIKDLTDTALSTTHNTLKKLEELGHGQETDAHAARICRRRPTVAFLWSVEPTSFCLPLWKNNHRAQLVFHFLALRVYFIAPINVENGVQHEQRRDSN